MWMPIVAKFRETREFDGVVDRSALMPRRRARFVTRFAVLCGRGFRELLRDPGVIMVRLAMYAMLSALIGAMYANAASPVRAFCRPSHRAGRVNGTPSTRRDALRALRRTSATT